MSETKLSAIILICILLALVVGVTIRSSFEAKTYNKLTGATVSTWDAVWVELRVVEPLKVEATE